MQYYVLKNIHSSLVVLILISKNKFPIENQYNIVLCFLDLYVSNDKFLKDIFSTKMFSKFVDFFKVGCKLL